MMDPVAIKTKTYSSGVLITTFVICFAGGVFGGITSTLMSSYLPVAINDLLGTTTAQQVDRVGAVINSMYLFGMMFGGMAFGFAGDRLGRKRSVQLSIACIGIFTALTAAAPQWWTVVMCRFLTGFGVGGVLVTTAILIDEIWTEKNKAVALGILSITIPVGIFSAGLITYFFENWRTGFLVGIIPVLLAVVSQWLMPESEKWRQHKITRMATHAVKTTIFQRSSRRDLIIGCMIYGAMLIGLWAVFFWLPTWVQSLLHNSDGQKERGISMMLFAVGGLSGGIISGWISNALGMKRTMLMCFAGTFLFSFLLFRLNTSITVLSYIEMAGIALFFGISQGVLNSYIPALFPVQIRSSATGFCFNAGRVFTASAVFFVGWLVTALNGYGNALFIFSFIFLVGFITTFFASDKKSTE